MKFVFKIHVPYKRVNHRSKSRYGSRLPKISLPDLPNSDDVFLSAKRGVQQSR